MNVGVLNNGNVTKHNYKALTATQLFAHNHIQEELQKIDPFDNTPPTGILGRGVKMLLNKYVFRANAVSLNQPSLAGFECGSAALNMVVKIMETRNPRGVTG